MDSGELTTDGFIDTGKLTGAILEADLRKIRLVALEAFLNEELPPDFQILVANEYLETPRATVELQFEVGVILFKENFIVMTSLARQLVELFFLKRHSTLLDMRQRVLNFPFFSMQSNTQTTRTQTITNRC